MSTALFSQDHPVTDRWSVGEVAFSWDDSDPASPSASELYALLLGETPAVVLSSRVPTVSMPCLGYARGEGEAAAVEVTVHGRDHAARVCLRPRQASLPWSIVLSVIGNLDAIHARGLPSRRVDVQLQGDADAFPTEFGSLVTRPGGATISHWFGDTSRHELTAPMAGELSIERSFVVDSKTREGGELFVRTAAVVRDHTDKPEANLPWAQLLDRAIRAVET